MRGRVIPVECPEEHGFKLTPEALERAASKGGARVLIMPYPNNPTGAVMTREEIAALLPVIEKYDLAVVSDEIYAELTYDGAHASVPSVEGFRDRTVLINGFSKAFAMTGWRLGYVAAPPEALAAMLKIHQYTALCAPTPSQYAGVAALREGREDGYHSVTDMKTEYNRRRRYIVGELNALGLRCRMPAARSTRSPTYPPRAWTGRSSRADCSRRRKSPSSRRRVRRRRKDYIRLSYATSLRTLTEAVKRMKRFLDKE